MIKHVGRHDNKKVAIMFRQVPDEEHMALVVYTESMPSAIHDELMKVVESEVGQSADNLGDAAFRHVMADGTNCLQAIHKSGLMKKVPTNQVIVTANASSQCRLDELNNILSQMGQGAEAQEKLAEMDRNAGMRKEPIAAKTTSSDTSGVNTASANNNNAALTDQDLANQLKDQAKSMRLQARELTAEAKRLDQQATALVPKKARNVKQPAKTKKTNSEKV